MTHDHFASRDKKDRAQSQVEKLSPPVVDRKAPQALRHGLVSPSMERSAAPRIGTEEKKCLQCAGEKVVSGVGPAELASQKNQVMDALLNQPQIPSDYGTVMVELYRDKSQDVLTRDFAVQHIGLYAQALARRGEYDADAAQSKELRSSLFDAATETRTIIAAAAFRALADIAVFDPRVDENRLDSLLTACAADASSDPASRSMAVQLCGERRVRSSRPVLETISDDPSSPAILRLAATHALVSITGKDLAQ